MKMATVFPHQASGDPIVGYQLSEVPPQPVPFLPVIPPPQGTVYFQPPYIFPSGLPQPVFCEQPNVPSLHENISREGQTNDNAGTIRETVPELSTSTVFYPPPPFPIPFPPPVHPFSLFSPYVRSSPVLLVLPSFADTSTSNPLPPLPPPLPLVGPKTSVPQSLPSSFASAPYQSWPITNTTSQSPTVRVTPRKDSISSTGANQSSLKLSGSDDCRNFRRDSGLQNRSEMMYRNRSGPSLTNYRTKLCINFKNGHCHYGDKCRFIHHPTSDGSFKTKFSTNAPAFVPRTNAMHTKPSSPSVSLDLIPSSRLYSSTPVSLLAKGQNSSLNVKERPTTPTGRRISYRQDFSAGYRRPSVADGSHPLPAC